MLVILAVALALVLAGSASPQNGAELPGSDALVPPLLPGAVGGDSASAIPVPLGTAPLLPASGFS